MPDDDTFLDFPEAGRRGPLAVEVTRGGTVWIEWDEKSDDYRGTTTRRTWLRADEVAQIVAAWADGEDR